MEEKEEKLETKEETPEKAKEPEVVKERPKRLEDTELWKMTSLVSRQSEIIAKMENLKVQNILLQREREESDRDIAEFQKEMSSKYGADAQATADGTLQYAPLPPKP